LPVPALAGSRSDFSTFSDIRPDAKKALSFAFTRFDFHTKWFSADHASFAEEAISRSLQATCKSDSVDPFKITIRAILKI
jgi:hypothetical protein